jgi:hypothetical protein
MSNFNSANSANSAEYSVPQTYANASSVLGIDELKNLSIEELINKMLEEADYSMILSCVLSKLDNYPTDNDEQINQVKMRLNTILSDVPSSVRQMQEEESSEESEQTNIISKSSPVNLSKIFDAAYHIYNTQDPKYKQGSSEEIFLDGLKYVVQEFNSISDKEVNFQELLKVIIKLYAGGDVIQGTNSDFDGLKKGSFKLMTVKYGQFKESLLDESQLDGLSKDDIKSYFVQLFQIQKQLKLFVDLIGNINKFCDLTKFKKYKNVINRDCPEREYFISNVYPNVIGYMSQNAIIKDPDQVKNYEQFKLSDSLSSSSFGFSSNQSLGSIYGLQNGRIWEGVNPMNLKVIGQMPNLNNVRRDYNLNTGASFGRRGSKRRGSKRRGSKRRGSKRRGSKRRGSKRRGSKRRGSKRRGSKRRGSKRRGSKRRGSKRRGSKRRGSKRSKSRGRGLFGFGVFTAPQPLTLF